MTLAGSALSFVRSNRNVSTTAQWVGRWDRTSRITTLRLQHRRFATPSRFPIPSLLEKPTTNESALDAHGLSSTPPVETPHTLPSTPSPPSLNTKHLKEEPLKDKTYKDPLDGLIEHVIYTKLLKEPPFLAHLEAQSGFPRLSALWNEYSSRSGTVINELVVPYEEYPDENRRADQNPSVTPQATEGDGIVLLIHVLLKQKVHSQDTGSLSQPYEIDRLSLCSGFALNAKPSPMSEEPACKDSQGDLIVSCAHTLEEVGNAQNRTRPRTID